MFKSKTLLFAFALAVFGAAQANIQFVQDIVTPELYGWLNIGFAVIVAGLRVLTTQPLSEKQ